MGRSLTIICVLGGPVDENGVPKSHLSLRLDQALRPIRQGDPESIGGDPHEDQLAWRERKLHLVQAAVVV